MSCAATYCNECDFVMNHMLVDRCVRCLSTNVMQDYDADELKVEEFEDEEPDDREA